MRVISGSFKGVKLEDKYSPKLRPTTDKVKESLFNILQFEIKDKSFLDLFGGTGQIGIEAFSRGAKKIVIVDKNLESINIIKKNVSKIRSENSIHIVKSSSEMFLKNNTEKFDIVFLDPPYLEVELLKKSFLCVCNFINKGGILVVETLKQTKILDCPDDFILQGSYEYGKIALYVYKN